MGEVVLYISLENLVLLQENTFMVSFSKQFEWMIIINW